MFEQQLDQVLYEIKQMLVNKNRKYGNSALEPVRIFSKASAKEQILVRLDDKLSRLANQQHDEDEDVVDDLLGYLILLKIAQNEECTEEEYIGYNILHKIEEDKHKIANDLNVEHPIYVHRGFIGGAHVIRNIHTKEDKRFIDYEDFKLWLSNATFPNLDGHKDAET